MASSKLSPDIQKTLTEGGFRFWGPCGCSIPGEDWKDALTREWNIRLYPSIDNFSLDHKGKVVDGGKTTKLKKALENRKPTTAR